MSKADLMKILAVLTVAAFLLPKPLEAQNPADVPGDELARRLMELRENEARLKEMNAKRLMMMETERSFNQEQYDVLHYDLRLGLNPTTHILAGSNIVTLEVVGAPISTVELNLKTNMSVSSATVSGSPTTWAHASNMLTINLDRAYDIGETVVVGVTYSGNPSGGSFGWDSHAGDTMIWTLSEPFGAREWWPCKDLNTDKADSMDIRVTVPEHLIVGSNGILVSDLIEDGSRTFHWRTGHAIVPYLVSLAIHPYTVYSDWYTPLDGGDPMEVRFYVFPDEYDDVQETYAKTVPMIEVFAEGFGEYPFVDEKYGHASFNWSGGMEHQTLTSLGGWWEDVISHELSHQWWGDYITCADFGHIWLNEGFAVWCEAYWKEMTEGFEVYRDYMDASAYYGPGTIFVEDPYTENIFDSNLSYNKGSWVVHMLRGVLGDADFFESLRLYQDLYGQGSATTEQLRDVCEGVSGLDLDAFFQQWIYGEYFPIYEYSWEVDRDGVLSLTVDQVQTETGLFTMPLRVRVVTDQGVQDFVVQNSLASHSYELPVMGLVESVQLDPDKWILRQIRSTVSNPTFADGILLVNGVDWDTYSSEIVNAYEARAFWGDFDIDFWDCFAGPSGGYPSTLPEPLGHGSVPADLVGRYSSLIWVGNNYNGDLADWSETPVASYLEVGGNLLLLSRMGESFLGGELTDFLGISWMETGSSLGNCVASYPGLVNIPFTGVQSYNDVFSTSVDPGSTLLFRDTAGFSGARGTGVHAQRPGGGTHRPEGARLIYLSGRPYRMNHDALRTNVEFLLEHFFDEPWLPTGTEAAPPAGIATLERNRPNPFNPSTEITFSLPADGFAELAVYDSAGRLVQVLASGRMPAGAHAAVWDGRDESGAEAASGVYLASLMTEGMRLSRKMLLLK